MIEGRVHTETDAAGAAEALRNAEKIVIVPGYGLAVAQAAGVVAEIALKLRKEGKDVKFAVHPVVSEQEFDILHLTLHFSLSFSFFVLSLPPSL